MRLSPTTAKGLMGQGGGIISVDGVVPISLSGAAGGGWGWLDDTTIAGQADLGSGYALRQLVLPNMLTNLSAGGASQFRAGNSKWAAFLSPGGVRSNILATLPLAGLGDIDELGRMTVVQSFSTGTGLVTYSAAGATLWSNSTGVVDGADILRSKNGSVAYEDLSGAWHIRDAATGDLQSFAPRTDELVAGMVPVKIGTVIYVVELTNTRLTIRPATSSMGYVLGTGATFFNSDAQALTSTSVRIGWSVTSGEGPTDMRVADLNITTGGTTLGSTTTGALVFGSSSAGTTAQFTVGPIEGGGTTAATKQPRFAAQPDGSGFVGARGLNQYQAWWDTIAGQAVAPPQASQIQGIVDPAHGGTGVTTGLTVLDGQNIIDGSLPLSAIEDQPESTLLGRGEGSGDGPVQDITLGAGLLMTGTVLSSVSSPTGGYWSPLTDGDLTEPELIFSLGDTIMVFHP